MNMNFNWPYCIDTPHGIACEKRGTKGIIFELIKNGANVYFRGKDGLTPLHRAAICSNHEAILTLVQAGASPICRDTKVTHSLMHAAWDNVK